jgi:hypothetical protein
LPLAWEGARLTSSQFWSASVPWRFSSRCSSRRPIASSNEQKAKNGNEFLRQASGKQAGLVSEFIGFLKANKKWWLAPIIISILLLGLLVVLGGTAAAPFIYALF